MANGAKKAIRHLLQCKAEGICERDKLINVYLAKRIEVYERRMQSIDEAFRDDNELPRCPPLCLEPPIDGETYGSKNAKKASK